MDLILSVTVTFWALYFIITKGITTSDNQPSETDSLVLLHVLFRHGDRTANGPEELYPKDPYLNETYFPVGLGQLTKVGKQKEYLIGVALRQRYTDFLGSVYYPDIVEAISTDYNRTKASLELVLAGLFPPEEDQAWNSALAWQPIPYNYVPRRQDKLLIGVYCPNYEKLYEEYIHSKKHLTETTPHKRIFDYISNHTGLNVTTFHDVYDLYFGIVTEEEWGFKLPQWTAHVWPDIIVDLTIKYYFIETATTELRQMASGYFLEKIIADTYSKINGSDLGRKVYLYSGHENNIADLLIILDVFEPFHVPPYGSYLIFEVHSLNDDGAYGIKIYYQNYSGSELQLLKLPACEEICELNKFILLIEEYLPKEDICGLNTSC